MHTYSFERLETWQKARLFRKEITLLSKHFLRMKFLDFPVR
jgi:hypothetical protein